MRAALVGGASVVALVGYACGIATPGTCADNGTCAPPSPEGGTPVDASNAADAAQEDGAIAEGGGG